MLKINKNSSFLNSTDLIQQRFLESGSLLVEFSKDPNAIQQVARVARVVAEALRKGGRVLIFGNGGSASDAQHFAAELVGGYTNHDRPPLDVLALSANTSNLTAIGNDYSYKEVFSRQVQAHARAGDVVIGISTSGNSPNVLAALETAKRQGACTVGMTGLKGGKLKGRVDIALCAKSNSTGRIQELHITAIHSICEMVEGALFPS